MVLALHELVGPHRTAGIELQPDGQIELAGFGIEAERHAPGAAFALHEVGDHTTVGRFAHRRTEQRDDGLLAYQSKSNRFARVAVANRRREVYLLWIRRDVGPGKVDTAAEAGDAEQKQRKRQN